MSGIGFLVSGIEFLASGIWFLVSDIGFLERCAMVWSIIIA